MTDGRNRLRSQGLNIRRLLLIDSGFDCGPRSGIAFRNDERH